MFRNRQDEEEEAAPRFDVPPQPVVTGEGLSARFLIKLTGNPTPQVEWFLDDQPIDLAVSSQTYRTVNGKKVLSRIM